MVSQNAIGNTVSDNDFSVNRATAGTAVVSTVAHSDNTNTASNAKSQHDILDEIEDLQVILGKLLD